MLTDNNVRLSLFAGDIYRMKRRDRKRKIDESHNDQKASKFDNPELNIVSTSFTDRLESLVWIPPLVIMVVVPFSTIKVLAGFALLISLRNVNCLSRGKAISFLGSLFAMSYLLSPYWLVPAESQKHCLAEIIGQTPAKAVTILILFAIGILWVWLAAGDIPAALDKKRKGDYRDWIAPSILGLVVLAFNYAALHNSIAVGGDEEWHIWRWEVLRSIVRPLFTGDNAAIAAIISLLLVGFLFFPKRPAGIIKLIVVCVIGLAACLWTGFPTVPKLEYLLVRYPFVSCWFHQLGPIWDVNRFDEAMFRLIPMLSSFAIGFFALWALRKEGAGRLIAIIVGLAFALTPNIYYHSTILYLELPAVALLLAALYFIEPLLKDDFETVRRCPGWYALLAAGFIKETLMILIFGMVGLRVLVRMCILLKDKGLNKRSILYEIAAIFCIAAPLGVYLFFRIYFGDVRTFTPNYSNLTNISFYAVAGKALWYQFAGLLILAGFGVIVCFVQKRFVTACSLLLLFVMHFFFYYLDNPDYIGLARFNLLLFGPLGAFALIFVVWLTGKSRVALLAVVVMCLIINLLLSPVAITGDKDPTWASPAISKSELYFQHEEAVNWLKVNRPNWPVLISGHYSKVRVYWYFAKAKYRTRFRSLKLKRGRSYSEDLKMTIANARKAGYPLVLFHRMKSGVTLTEEEKSVLGYKAVKIFRNRYRALVLYQIEKLPQRR